MPFEAEDPNERGRTGTPTRDGVARLATRFCEKREVEPRGWTATGAGGLRAGPPARASTRVGGRRPLATLGTFARSGETRGARRLVRGSESQVFRPGRTERVVARARPPRARSPRREAPGAARVSRGPREVRPNPTRTRSGRRPSPGASGKGSRARGGEDEEERSTRRSRVTSGAGGPLQAHDEGPGGSAWMEDDGRSVQPPDEP